ncbi:MAG TPA: MFS transporter [Nitrososphaeraceae archaeon]|nr:MFS transporter [Nitrososphaeraceae archaeon]
MKSRPRDYNSKSGQPNKTYSTNIHYRSNSARIPTYAWKMLAILSCIATMVMYAETMLIPAIPDLIGHFHVSYGMSSWILTSYLIAGAVMTPIAGKLSDIYGRKKILLIIMVIYAVGVSLAGFATDIYFMIFARAIQGIGMSMFPIAFGMIRDQFPREKISIGQGVITSMFASGAVIGLTVGGIIVEDYGWQYTFFTIIPIAIALLLVIWRFIHVTEINVEDQSQKRPKILKGKNVPIIGNIDDKRAFSKASSQIDIKGAIALAITIASFLLVLTLLETSGSNLHTVSIANGNTSNNDNLPSNTNPSLNILPFLIIGIIALIFFVIIERREKYPLVDFRLMFNKSILPANLIIMLVGFSMFMVFQTVPILVRNPEPVGFGEDAIIAGKVQLPFAIVLLIFGPTSGFIVSKLGSLRPIILGTFITTAGFMGLLMFHSTELLVSVNLGILSTGLSLTSVGAINVIILSTPRQFSGISLGMTSLMRIVGASIGPALAGMYMQTNQTLLDVSGIINYFPSAISFEFIFLSAVIVSVASIVLAIILRQRVTKMAIPNLT